jgi:hypothetical protein
LCTYWRGGNDIFFEEDEMDIHTDLYQLFGSESRIIFALQHRFDDLPIHSIVYYQSYHAGVLHILIAAINMRLSRRQTLITTPKLDLTGNLQDCIGMTPLHILTCSAVHNLELYRLIVETYPANLITEDRWGATPLLYAFWGGAPAEIIEFLLDRYQSLYPNHVFNWAMMVETMGQCHTPKENIECLLCAKQMHFPEQPIDWEYLLTQFAGSSSRFHNDVLFQEQMRFLFMGGMSVRVKALAFKLWRDHVTNMINTASFAMGRDNSAILHTISAKLDHFDDELTKLKEVTTILELALWKMKIWSELTLWKMKIKSDEARSPRQQCRITCGADVIIGHVLTFLVTI